MGLLDSVIGSVVGQVLGGGRGGGRGGGLGGGQGHGGSGGNILSSPIVKALLMLLMAKAASGGLGDLLGGGRREPHSTAPEPYDPDAEAGPSPYGRGPGPDDGDLGGFGGPQHDGPSRGGRGEDDFSDLSGMLDGPGDRSPGQGPYAHLDHEPGQEDVRGGMQGGGDGLGGLIESFQRGGLGDVIGSWIGSGQNQPVAPNRLADALGRDTVDTLSRQTGMNRDDLLRQLAEVLPEVVNQLTPHGRMPSADERRGWL